MKLPFSPGKRLMCFPLYHLDMHKRSFDIAFIWELFDLRRCVWLPCWQEMAWVIFWCVSMTRLYSSQIFTQKVISLLLLKVFYICDKILQSFDFNKRDCPTQSELTSVFISLVWLSQNITDLIVYRGRKLIYHSSGGWRV